MSEFISGAVSMLTDLQATYQSLPPGVQRMVGSAAGVIVKGVTSSAVKGVKARVLSSEEEKAWTTALGLGIARVVARWPEEAQAIDLARALGRPPFAQLIRLALEDPTRELDPAAVRAAFDESPFDLPQLGIDEFDLLRTVRAETLEALRLGRGEAARAMATGVVVVRTERKVDDVHVEVREMRREMNTTLEALAAGERQRTAAALPDGSVASADDALRPRMDDAKALFDQGAVSAAGRLWERARDDALSSATSPELRGKIFNNLGAVYLDQERPEDALRAFQQGLEYLPNHAPYVANLALAHRAAGRDVEARVTAARAMAIDNTSPEVWYAHVATADAVLGLTDLPEALRGDPWLIFALGTAAMRRNSPHGVPLLREAIRIGPRDPQVLLVLAEAILTSLYPRRSRDPVPIETLDELQRLADEVERALISSDRMSWRARTAELLGAISALRGDPQGGAAHYHRALQLTPAVGRARFALADQQLRAGNGAVAAHLLDAIPVAGRDAGWAVLAAQAALLEDPTADVDAHVSMVLNAHDDPQQAAIATVMLEALLEVANLKWADALIALMENALPTETYVFRARVAARRGDDALAQQEYIAALRIAPASIADGLRLEVAMHAHVTGRHAEAVALFAASTSLATDEEAIRAYAVSLAHHGDLATLDSVLSSQLATEPPPLWALGLDTDTASERNDLPRARRSLEQFVALQPDHTSARINLAQIYVRLREQALAHDVLAPLLERHDLSAAEVVNLALVLGQLGEHVIALPLAARALRTAPDNADVQNAAIGGVYLGAIASGADLRSAFDADVVGPDTWVRLEDSTRRSLDYLLVTDGPTTVAQREFVYTDSRVAMLLGRRVGDEVLIHPGTFTAATYRVVELKTLALHVFHQAIEQNQLRFPDNAAVQVMPVGTGSAFDPRPILLILEQQRQHAEQLLHAYRTHWLPLGMIARGLSRSVRRLYLHLLEDPAEAVFVERPGPAALAVAYRASQSPTVVLTETGLAALEALNLTSLLPQLFARVLLPQSLLDHLMGELAELERAVAQGGSHTAVAHGGRIHGYEVPSDVVASEHARLRETLEVVRGFSEIRARPAGVSFTDSARLREVLGETSFDSMALVSEDISVHADDLGFRTICEEKTGVGGFSTFTLLQRAHDAMLIDAATLADAVQRLLAWGHVALPVSDAVLFTTFEQGGFQLSRQAMRLLEVATDPAWPLSQQLASVTGLLQRVAVSAGRDLLVAPITTITLARITRGRSPSLVVNTFLESAQRVLKLLPAVYDEVAESAGRWVAASDGA